MTDGNWVTRIAAVLEGSAPTPVATALENLALPGDLPADLRTLLDRPLKPAAVLVALMGSADDPDVLFTRRNANLRHHGGQISFPGGALESADAGPVEAALREAREETGMDTSRVQVLGYLDTYVTITGFAVTPVVARVPDSQELVADPGEVAELFEVPLAFLMDAANHRRHVGERNGLSVRYYSIPYGGKNIWGATAGMLVNLYKKVLTTKSYGRYR